MKKQRSMGPSLSTVKTDVDDAKNKIEAVPGTVVRNVKAGFEDLKTDVEGVVTSGFADVKAFEKAGFADVKTDVEGVVRTGFADVKAFEQAGFDDVKAFASAGFQDVEAVARTGFQDVERGVEGLAQSAERGFEHVESFVMQEGREVVREGEKVMEKVGAEVKSEISRTERRLMTPIALMLGALVVGSVAEKGLKRARAGKQVTLQG